MKMVSDQGYGAGLYPEYEYEMTDDVINNETYDLGNIDYTVLNFTNIWVRKPGWEMAIKAIAVFPIMTIGIIGNLAVICFILRLKSLRDSHINLFILNMAIADLLTTMICPWVSLVKTVYQNYELGPIICKLEPISMLCLLASVFSLITISIDRFIATVYPSKRHLNRKTSLIIITFIWFLAICLSYPLFSWRVYRQRQWMDYLEKWCAETTTAISHDYWLYLMLPLVYIPILVLVCVYSVIIRRMDRYEKAIAINETPVRIKHRRIIIQMLFIYLLTLVICWLPLQVCVYTRRFKYAAVPLPRWYGNVSFITSLFAAANSAINPVVTFRKSFSHLLPKLFKPKKKTTANGITPLDVAIIREHLRMPRPSLSTDSTQKQLQMVNISNGSNTTSFTKQIMMKRAPELFLRDEA